MIEHIRHKDKTIAIIVGSDFHREGITFFTENDVPLQLGYMSHPKGHEITPHVHNPIKRETTETYEVLLVKKGRIRIDFFSYSQEYLESRELMSGDITLLVGAGHGIVCLEPTIIVEAKNGPYYSEKDKKRFPNPRTSSSASDIKEDITSLFQIIEYGKDRK